MEEDNAGRCDGTIEFQDIHSMLQESQPAHLGYELIRLLLQKVFLENSTRYE